MFHRMVINRIAVYIISTTVLNWMVLLWCMEHLWSQNKQCKFKCHVAGYIKP